MSCKHLLSALVLLIFISGHTITQHLKVFHSKSQFHFGFFFFFMWPQQSMFYFCYSNLACLCHLCSWTMSSFSDFMSVLILVRFKVLLSYTGKLFSVRQTVYWIYSACAVTWSNMVIIFIFLRISFFLPTDAQGCKTKPGFLVLTCLT